MSRHPILLLILPALLAACGGEPEDTRPGQPVAHRRAAFKDMIKVFEPMGVVVRSNGAYNAAKFQSLAMQLIAVRDKPWEYFKPDTLYPPSRARAEVWAQPEKFEAEKKAFYEATDKLVAVAGTADKRIAGAAFADVQKTCKSCHDTFKTE